MALDEGVGEVVEASPRLFIEGESVRLHQPYRHLSLLVLNCQRETVLLIFVFVCGVAAVHPHQVLDDVDVAGVGSHVYGLALARRRPNLRIHILHIYQILHQVYFSGDTCQV